MSLPLSRYYRVVFTVPTVLLWNFSRPRDNYRGYRGIAAFPITVSSSNWKQPVAKQVQKIRTSHNAHLALFLLHVRCRDTTERGEIGLLYSTI